MKEYAEKFYSSKEWQECRKAYAASKQYLCEDCLKKGLITPGEIVHHIIHLTPANIDDPSITLNFNNLRLVCRECHAAEHGAKANLRYIIDSNGKVIPNPNKY